MFARNQTFFFLLRVFYTKVMKIQNIILYTLFICKQYWHTFNFTRKILNYSDFFQFKIKETPNRVLTLSTTTITLLKYYE